MTENSEQAVGALASEEIQRESNSAQTLPPAGQNSAIMPNASAGTPAESDVPPEQGYEPYYREIDNAVARMTRLFVLGGAAGFLTAIFASTLICGLTAQKNLITQLSEYSALVMVGIMVLGLLVWLRIQFFAVINSLILASFLAVPGRNRRLFRSLLHPIGRDRSKMGLALFAIATGGVLVSAFLLGIYANMTLLRRLFSPECLG